MTTLYHHTFFIVQALEIYIVEVLETVHLENSWLYHCFVLKFLYTSLAYIAIHASVCYLKSVGNSVKLSWRFYGDCSVRLCVSEDMEISW